jgi:hypothetical protein
MARRVVILAAIVLCAMPGLALVGSLDLRLDAGLFGLFGGKTQPPPGWTLHKQHVELADVHFRSADKECENWSWVAGIVDMAETRGAHIDQQYLIDRLYGGSRCLPSAGDLADMTQRISHDYILEDGQKFRIEAQFTPGAPTQADPLILSIRQLRPVMLVWHSRCYLLTAMDYDEYIGPTGSKMFIVTALGLFDPVAPEGKRDVTFSRDVDNPNDLNGVVDLSIHTK